MEEITSDYGFLLRLVNTFTIDTDDYYPIYSQDHPKRTSADMELRNYGCSNHSNLEMEAEFLTKNMSYLNLNISRTKNGRNKL